MTRNLTKRTMVVIAEDDPDDRLLIKDALKEANPSVEVYFVVDGAEMLDYLYHRGKYERNENLPHPELVLLDLNMPRVSGMEVLREIKQDQALRSIPVVVLTTSRSPEDVALSYELGGNGFITKPDSFTKLVEIMDNLDRYWFNTVKLP
jgi:CheY-like chemotaxis protein